MILPVPSEVEHSVLLEHEFAISQLVVQRRELEGSLFCKILHVVVKTVISHQEQDFSDGQALANALMQHPVTKIWKISEHVVLESSQSDICHQINRVMGGLIPFKRF